MRQLFSKAQRYMRRAPVPATPPLLSSFVERFPRLLLTSTTGIAPERLNKRYRALIEGNRDLIAGKRILDLASHDGRWTLAALELGAAHVTGIEARPRLVAHAHANCLAYSIGRSRVQFIHGEVFGTLSTGIMERFDTVLCFGFFYHIARHVELIALIDRLKPSAVIIDTCISSGPDWSREWIREQVQEEANAVSDIHARGGWALVGYPTRRAVDLLWGHFGYQVSEIDWKPFFEDGVTGIEDYFADRRASFLAIRAT